MDRGQVGHLTDVQNEKIEQLRTAVEDILSSEHDDYYLSRWLRARNFDVQSAERMLRRHMLWKLQYGVDTIIDDYNPSEVLKQYYPGGLVGHDRQDCPFWIIPLGSMDLKGLCHAVKKTDMMRYTIRQLQISEEEMREQTDRTGKIIDTHSFILDMDNFSMKALAWKPAVDIVTQMVTMFEDHYPERLKKVYVINAPKYFPLAYALVKPFLAEETARKVYVYDTGSMWRKRILEDIDEDEIPSHWGGLKVDPVDGDPRCPSLICLGGTVPCSYYTAPSRRLSIDQSMDTIMVNKKAFQCINEEVTVPGSMLKWEFKTEEHDIGFAIYRQRAIEELEGPNSGDDEEIIVPPQRVNCQLVPEDGFVVVDKVGKYVFKFDNTYSWYRSKRVMYSIQVIPPVVSLNHKGPNEVDDKEEEMSIK